MPGRYVGPTYKKFQTPEARKVQAFLRKKLGQLLQILGEQGKQYGVLRGMHTNGKRWWVRIIPNAAGGSPLTQIFSEMLKTAAVTDDSSILAGFEVSTYLAELLGAYAFKESTSCFIVVKGTLNDPIVRVLDSPPDPAVDPADNLPHQPIKTAVDWSAPGKPIVTWFGEHRYKWRGPFAYGGYYPVAPLDYTDTHVLAGYEKNTVFQFVMCEGVKYKIIGCVRGAGIQVVDGIKYLLVLYHDDVGNTTTWSLEVFALGNTAAKKFTYVYFPIPMYFSHASVARGAYQYPCSHALFNADGTSAVFTQTVRIIDIDPNHPDSIWAEYYHRADPVPTASEVFWDYHFEPILGYIRPLAMVMGRVNITLTHDPNGELVVTTDTVFPESHSALSSSITQATGNTPPDGRPTDDFDYTSNVIAGPGRAFLADFVGNSLAILKVKTEDSITYAGSDVTDWWVTQGVGCGCSRSYDSIDSWSQTQSIVITKGTNSHTIFSRSSSGSSIVTSYVHHATGSEAVNTSDRTVSADYTVIELLHADLRYGFITFLEHTASASGSDNVTGAYSTIHHGFFHWVERNAWRAFVDGGTFNLFAAFDEYQCSWGGDCIPVWAPDGHVENVWSDTTSHNLGAMLNGLSLSSSAVVYSQIGEVIVISYVWDGKEPSIIPPSLPGLGAPTYCTPTNHHIPYRISMEFDREAVTPIAFSAIILPNNRILTSPCIEVTAEDTPRTVSPFQFVIP